MNCTLSQTIVFCATMNTQEITKIERTMISLKPITSKVSKVSITEITEVSPVTYYSANRMCLKYSLWFKSLIFSKKKLSLFSIIFRYSSERECVWNDSSTAHFSNSTVITCRLNMQLLITRPLSPLQVEAGGEKVVARREKATWMSLCNWIPFSFISIP